ncbi:MAG: carbohydrate ABC transporter permease [Phycisphaerales bacterium JB039]
MRLPRRVMLYAALIAGSVVLMFPLWWMTALSLSTEAEARKAMTSGGVMVWPEKLEWGNYPEALQRMGAAAARTEELPGTGAGEEAGGAAPGVQIARADPWLGFKDALANSVVITVLCVVGNVLSCSLVGYAFARLRFRGSRGLFLVTLATMMLPQQVTMIPLFLVFRGLGWLDTILPLVVPAFFGTAFFIFMFRQFFAQQPEEILEAARIDGASEIGVWWRVMLPICRPVAAVTAIFTFIWTWNDFLGPLIYLQSPEKFTLALALNTFKSQFGGVRDAHLLMAASVVTMIPCIALFVAAQRHFVRGLNLGAVKG